MLNIAIKPETDAALPDSMISMASADGNINAVRLYNC